MTRLKPSSYGCAIPHTTFQQNHHLTSLAEAMQQHSILQVTIAHLARAEHEAFEALL
jgi:hypothetical protein